MRNGSVLRLKRPQERLRACYQHLGAITFVPYSTQCGQKVIRCKGKNVLGFKKTSGNKKRPQRGAFLRPNDRLVNNLRTSPANASDKNSARWLVVNVAHRIGGLAEDHGLNAECIDNSDTGADLFVDQHL